MGRIKKLLSSYREALSVLAGEIVVSLIVVAVYALIGSLDYTVVTGVALGSVVTVVNLFILSVSVNRAVDKYLALRGDREMSDEEATAFAEEHMKTVQLAASGTYLLRTILMLAALVSAFLFSSHFNVLATVIPLIMCRPIMYVAEIIRIRISNKDVQSNVNTVQNASPYPEDESDTDPSDSGESDPRESSDEDTEDQADSPELADEAAAEDHHNAPEVDDRPSDNGKTVAEESEVDQAWI